MQNNEYLSEERYQQTNAKVKNVGKILLITGIIILVVSFVLTVVGFVGFGNTATGMFDSFSNFGNTSVNDIDSFNSFGSEIDTMKNTTSSAFGNMGLFALGGSMGTLGFLLTAAGALIMFIAHRREITAYATQQVMPVAQEGIEKMTPTVANAAGSIAKSISQGIQEGKSDADSTK